MNGINIRVLAGSKGDAKSCHRWGAGKKGLRQSGVKFAEYSLRFRFRRFYYCVQCLTNRFRCACPHTRIYVVFYGRYAGNCRELLLDKRDKEEKVEKILPLDLFLARLFTR